MRFTIQTVDRHSYYIFKAGNVVTMYEVLAVVKLKN